MRMQNKCNPNLDRVHNVISMSAPITPIKIGCAIFQSVCIILRKLAD